MGNMCYRDYQESQNMGGSEINRSPSVQTQMLKKEESDGSVHKT